MANSRVISDHSRSNLIYDKNTPCNYIYFVVEGSVKVSTFEEDKEHISIILHKGNIFGECCLYGQEMTQFSAHTIEERTRIISINVECFKILMKHNFEFNLKVIEMIGEKIKKSEERLHNFATKDARQRIVEFLKENVENNGRRVGLEMLIKHGLTQQDIANFTGTSRQTVTTVLNDLKSKNKIHLRRKSILIRDLTALV
ncbi:MAG: Crp/Fnr family transcriptional regulator [Saprospiraceae bacterium]|nr:Crp/Fnr family transcriptional regulator [Saprospiraceae bacterium]